jgi:hypothetical protein
VKRPDIRVDDNGPADFHTIQAAVDAASEGETIVVSQGLYVENVRIEGKNIRLRSTDPNDPNVVAATIIDGGFAGPVVTFSGTESDACLLRGFTLQNGSAPQGGGICGNGTSAVIGDNVICDNVASGGPTGPDLGIGGGLFACRGVIQRNTITGNVATIGGGLAFCAGTIADNLVAGNAALHTGGGLYECAGPIQGNLISGNRAAIDGGGLSDCNGPIHHNLVVGNVAAEGTGGGLHECDGRVENNTIVGNRAGPAGGGLSACNSQIVNCIIWANGPDQMYLVSDVSYCDVQSGWPGEGNLDVDPGFAQPGYWDPNLDVSDPGDDFWVDGDYHLPSQAWRLDPIDQTWSRDETTSPCIDKGDPDSPLGEEPFPHGGRINLGAYGGTAQAALSYYGEQGYAGGKGTETAPFILCIPQHLVTLTGAPDQWDKSFRLHNDIDVTDWPNLIGPIGNSDSRFSGTFDGNEKAIVGLTIVWSKQMTVGLFGNVRDGRIMRVRLVAPVIDAASTNHIGALVGSLGGGEIRDCHVEEVSVYGLRDVGGLVGSNTGLVTRSSSGGAVWGLAQVGGLVGLNSRDIRDCFSTARTQATWAPPAWAVAGGLVGRNSGTIRDCYACGKVLGQKVVGGLVGQNRGEVAYCYATGIVLGREDIGGLVGHSYGGQVYLSYWDKQASGRWVSADGTGKTTAELQRAATFVGWPDTGSWTLAEAVDYPRLAWESVPGQPLAGPDPLASFDGAGTPDDPYLIHTADELVTVASFPSQWDKHFRLAADIDMGAVAPAPAKPLGDELTPFSGTFDGAGHTIGNLNYVASMSYLALFGIVNGPDASIENLALTNPRVDGHSYTAALAGELQQGRIVNCVVQGASISGVSYTAVLVGRNAGTIARCQVQGSVTAFPNNAGGLVGLNDGTITQCQATGSVHVDEPTSSFSQYAGGLVGRNRGDIDNCYSRCSAYADQFSGGLVGRNDGSVKYCYAGGRVTGSSYVGGFCGRNYGETIAACFWDAQRYGLAESDGGVSKTTAELKQAATFLAAGWDFVGETANGTADIWTIAEGIDYPRFAWESALDGAP